MKNKDLPPICGYEFAINKLVNKKKDSSQFKGKSNLKTPSTTSIPVTGESVLEKVLLEKSNIKMELMIVKHIPMPTAIFTSIDVLEENIFSSKSEMFLNNIHDAINTNQNKPCSSS